MEGGPIDSKQRAKLKTTEASKLQLSLLRITKNRTQHASQSPENAEKTKLFP